VFGLALGHRQSEAARGGDFARPLANIRTEFLHAVSKSVALVSGISCKITE